MNPPWEKEYVTFLPDSKLYEYLKINQRHYITENQTKYNYGTIQAALRHEIYLKNLYDESNPRIIILNKELEDIFHRKYIFADDFKHFVLKEFVPKITHIEWRETSQVPLFRVFRSPLWSRGIDKYMDIKDKVSDEFDIDASYKLTPKMYEILKEFLPQDIEVFAFRNICSAMSKYIINNKENLIYPKNITIVVAEGTLFEDVFGLKTFSRHQVPTLIKSQCIPMV
jgi:hypothetical protein